MNLERFLIQNGALAVMDSHGAKWNQVGDLRFGRILEDVKMEICGDQEMGKGISERWERGKLTWKFVEDMGEYGKM